MLVSPIVRIDWGPDEEYVREQPPLEKILLEEKIALNAHIALRNDALEEMKKLEEILEDIDDQN